MAKMSINLAYYPRYEQYRVVKLVNRIEPPVGEYLKQDAVNALIQTAHNLGELTVNIEQAKD